jgi:hypothetical protein
MRRLLVVVIALCLAGAAFAATGPTGNKWDTSTPKGLGDGASNPRTGGDTIETATVIPSLPYSDTGATCGFVQNYTDCVYNAGAPDVVYAYTPAANGAMNVSLCGSGYDTALWVYAGGVGNTVGCNDDFCGLQSEIDQINITAGVTYYIVISGYSTACGSYILNVTPVQPCDVVCPAGSQMEGEPACYDGYVDNYNGGCNSTGWTVVNGDANGNADVCGLSGTYIYNGGSYRDTDWYDCVGGGGTASMAVEAEFALQIIFIYGTDCNNLLYDYTTAPMCVTATLSRTVASGVHFWPWVGASVFSNVPCTSAYWMHLTGIGGIETTGACCIGLCWCEVMTQEQCHDEYLGEFMGGGTVCDPSPCFCPTGACCRQDGSCFETTAYLCDEWYHDVWQGPGTDCDPNPCSTPTEKTTWGTIKQMYRGR